ncbi:MAG: hypothetical protein ACOX4I_01235 [Anaerovoracaceae bacterium]|jgi:hypothetical protein
MKVPAKISISVYRALLFKARQYRIYHLIGRARLESSIDVDIFTRDLPAVIGGQEMIQSRSRHPS